MRKSLSRIATLAGRNLLEIARDPLSLFFMMALPLIMEILFYFLFHKSAAQFEMRYLAPAIVAFSQAFLTLFVGLLIAVDRGSAFLTRLYVSGARPHEFILGYALALLPIALVQSVLFFLVGGAIDPSLFGIGMLWGILTSLVTSILYIALGILFGSICNEKSVGGISSIVTVGQSVLSGMWFPLEGIRPGIVIAMKCLPFKNATDLIQNVLGGVADPWLNFGLPLVIVLAYSAVALTAAILVFGHKMKAK
ncbi:MAG: ABC transporter permease [Clostridia bacterium]|nr:ABC transporter permease [Clostridia bacterium]